MSEEGRTHELEEKCTPKCCRET